MSLGDSWSDPNYYGYRNEVECWDSKVAKRLGYNLVNRGLASASNEKIVKLGIDYLSKNEAPDLICVLWSEQHRIDFFNYLCLIPFNSVFTRRVEGVPLDYNEMTDILLNPDAIFEQLIRRGNDRYIPTEFFRNMWTLQYIADQKGIPIYHAAGVTVWNSWLYRRAGDKQNPWDKNPPSGRMEWKRFLNYWLDSQYFEDFEKRQDNIVGWPFLRDLGGYALTERLNNTTQRISETDKHPSDWGMEIIAHEFLKKIKV